MNPNLTTEGLTKEELETIESIHKYAQQYWWLRIKEESNFNLGDVLIKMTLSNWGAENEEDKYAVELISEKSKTPRKYKVVHIDKYGVPFVKVIKTNNKLGEALTSLATVDPSYGFFKVDPEFLEHTLLAEEGAEFNAAERFKEIKKQRNQIMKLNKKLRFKFDKEKIEELDVFISNLKPKDVLWLAPKFNDDVAHSNKLTVKKIFKFSIDHDSKHGIYLGYYEKEEYKKRGIKEAYAAECTVHSSGVYQPTTLTMFYLQHCYIYTTQPHSYEVKIK